MADMSETLPAELLTLWSKLGPAFRLLRQWDRRSGIVFITAGDQGLAAARQVAHALAGKTIELAETGVERATYDKQIGKYLDGSVADGAARFAGMDRLCVIIPRIDQQPKWLRDKIKGYCEQAPRPFALLMTCADQEWMPSYLKGHLYECRKKSAAPK